MEANKLICTDCIEWMRAQPADSVDLVFGSPPYEAQRTYGIGFNLKGQAWVEWMVEVFRASLHVSRGLVAFVVEGNTRRYRWSATPALLMADLHRAGINLRKPPIYNRIGIPGSGGPDWLRNDFEFIVCATKPGKLAWSDNTAMGHPPKWAPGGAMSNRTADGRRRNAETCVYDMQAKRKNRDKWGSTGNATGMAGRYPNGKHKPRAVGRLHTKREPDGSLREQSYNVPVKANPGNVVKCIVGGGVMGSKLSHDNEASFPERLAEFFVQSYCPPGGITLDPFVGSGTTTAVAQKKGRRWIGLDVRESQIELARYRMIEAKLKSRKETK